MGLCIDTPWWQPASVLKSRNVDLVVRYLCMPYNTGPGSTLPNKRLERAELEQKLAAGIDVAVNWEDAADDYLGGYARGLDKGRRAADWMLNQLGWPAGGSCCSSLDADIGPVWGGLAAEYQRGFAEGLTGGGPYVPGVYGSAVALNGARADGTAKVFWLTAASSWSHGQVPVVMHLEQNGYWQWGDDADVDYRHTQPMGSYLQAEGGIVNLDGEDLDAIEARFKRVLNVKNAYVIPDGQASNDRVPALLLGMAQGNVNQMNRILAGLDAIPTNAESKAALDGMTQTILDAVAAVGVDPDVVKQAIQDAVSAGMANLLLSVKLAGTASGTQT